MKFLNVYDDENGKMFKICLQESIREYIFTKIIKNPSKEEEDDIKKV